MKDTIFFKQAELLLRILPLIEKDITEIYEKEFRGMIAEDIPVEALIKSRSNLVKKLREELTENERRFILSVKKARPEWDLLDLDGVQDFPAVKWKLKNIMKMDPIKHHEAVEKLKKYLNI